MGCQGNRDEARQLAPIYCQGAGRIIVCLGTGEKGGGVGWLPCGVLDKEVGHPVWLGC